MVGLNFSVLCCCWLVLDSPFRHFRPLKPTIGLGKPMIGLGKPMIGLRMPMIGLGMPLIGLGKPMTDLECH